MPRLLASVLALLWPTPALAWGDIGHRIICEIAFQELEPAMRERVKAMIRRDPEFDTFAEACTWPDRPRQRAVEHYVNLPRDAEGFTDDPCPWPPTASSPRSTRTWRCSRRRARLSRSSSRP
jgi:hypothetical protein